jgi:hypothetical protein
MEQTQQNTPINVGNLEEAFSIAESITEWHLANVDSVYSVLNTEQQGSLFVALRKYPRTFAKDEYSIHFISYPNAKFVSNFLALSGERIERLYEKSEEQALEFDTRVRESFRRDLGNMLEGIV